MSIASKLTALQADITAARTAITTKGGTVTSGGGSSHLATDIATIPTGITPTGTLSITANGNYDVTTYASASVNVPQQSMKWGGKAEDFFCSEQPTTPTLSDIVIDEGRVPALAYVFENSGIKSITTRGPFTSEYYIYEYMCRNCKSLQTANFFREAGGTYVYQYMCRGMFTGCTALKTFYCNVLAPNQNYCCDAMFNGCSALEKVTFDLLGNNNFTSYAFRNACKDCTSLTAFELLTGSVSAFLTVGNGSSNTLNFNYCFQNAVGMYNETFKTFRAPMLKTIGLNSGTTTHSCFKQAFYLTSAQSAYYGKMHILLPELTAIYNRATASSSGHFYGCNALGKVYLPKFTADGTTGQYIFSTCAYITEIHFGIENQATVSALAGYSSKFGATNATLYFDLVNHITVNGVVYDRSGVEYDYDTSHYSWKNGNNVIYTTNALTPAVGDSVYTKSGDTYTASGTITAIA